MPYLNIAITRWIVEDMEMANRREPTEVKPEVANAMHGHIKRTSAIKSLYVADVDAWERWKLFAEEKGMSMSEFLMAAAEKFASDKCPVCTRVAEVLATGSFTQAKTTKAKK